MSGGHLLGAAIAAALLLAGVAVALLVGLERRRARLANARAAESALPMICPSCRRAFPAGTRFCPLDATRLQLAHAAQGPGRGGRCPRCRRSFEAGMRFCPMDAEELVPPGHLHSLHAGASLAEPEPMDEHLVGGDGKICPLCASKYDLAAGYCGRDAAVLVTIN